MHRIHADVYHSACLQFAGVREYVYSYRPSHFFDYFIFPFFITDKELTLPQTSSDLLPLHRRRHFTAPHLLGRRFAHRRHPRTGALAPRATAKTPIHPMARIPTSRRVTWTRLSGRPLCCKSAEANYLSQPPCLQVCASFVHGCASADLLPSSCLSHERGSYPPG
jgi:hypothetical protein